MVVRDPGTQTGMKVTSEGRAMSYAITESESYHSGEEGFAYHIVLEQTPTSTDDCFFYMKNTNDRDLVIVGYSGYAATADVVEFNLNPTGTPVSGTDITPVNIKGSSSENLDGTFQSGVDITGLTKGSTFHKAKIGTSQFYEIFPSAVWVQKNGTFGLWAVTGTYQINLTLLVHYEPDL